MSHAPRPPTPPRTRMATAAAAAAAAAASASGERTSDNDTRMTLSMVADSVVPVPPTVGPSVTATNLSHARWSLGSNANQTTGANIGTGTAADLVTGVSASSRGLFPWESSTLLRTSTLTGGNGNGTVGIMTSDATTSTAAVTSASTISPLIQGLRRLSPHNNGPLAGPGPAVALATYQSHPHPFAAMAPTAFSTTMHYTGWNRSPRRSSLGLMGGAADRRQSIETSPFFSGRDNAAVETYMQTEHHPVNGYEVHGDSTNPTGKHGPETGEPAVVIDGIPVQELRALVQSSLEIDDSDNAAYFAAIVYAKTEAPMDALALARAHQRQSQPVACLRVLEEATLLLLPTTHPEYGLVWEALLLACTALASRDDYVALVELIEDACRLPLLTAEGTRRGESALAGGTSHASPPLEDSDDEGWEALSDFVSRSIAGRISRHQATVIHPLARLCWWRGRGYHAAGHGVRACVYWRRALHIDGRCVQAWEDLLRRQLITPHAAYQILLPSSDTLHHGPENDENCHDRQNRRDDAAQNEPFHDRTGLTVRFTHNYGPTDTDRHGSIKPSAPLSSATHSPMNWLHTLYMSRIELALQDRVPSTASTGTNKTNPVTAFKGTSLFKTAPLSAVEKTPFGKQGAESLTPFSFGAEGMLGMAPIDASMIHMTSPVPTFQTPEATMSDPTLSREYRSSADDVRTKASPIEEDVNAAFGRLWTTYKLHRCPHVLATAARRAYRRCEWKKALTYCRDLMQLDPSLGDAAFCYISTLVVLGHKRVLFGIAHEWVEAAPREARSWFAVGAYYYACERYHVAQRHFCRATRLDPQCTEAWIAFGCAFAACDESDQAMASFRAAQRLSQGEHYTLLYMGMEYVRTNHLSLAEYFLQSAVTASGGDPLCLHELGVLVLQKGDPAGAIGFFERALHALVGTDSLSEAIDMCGDPHWEATLFNLGHCYRKTRQFVRACECFSRCIALRPDKHSTYSALAFTTHLMGDVNTAIEYYHQALSLKADDPFSTEMINRALQEALTSSHRFWDDENVKTRDSSGPALLNMMASAGGNTSTEHSFSLTPTAQSLGNQPPWSRRMTPRDTDDGDVNMSIMS